MKLSKRSSDTLVICIMLALFVTPLVTTQILMKINRNKSRLGIFTIESVECTDTFGEDLTLKIRSEFEAQYRTFPQKILKHTYGLYVDNKTTFNCYGWSSDGFYYATLFIKARNGYLGTVTYNFNVTTVTLVWSKEFSFGGGDLLITFRLFSLERWF